MEKWEHNNVNTTDAPWEALKVSMEDQVATIPTPVRSDPTHAGPDDDTIPAVFFSPSGVVSTGSQSCDWTEDSSQDMEGCGVETSMSLQMPMTMMFLAKNLC